MKSVTISTLKAQLSAHIQLVRNGEEIIVRDRNKPVARLISCESEDYTVLQNRLVAEGKLIPPKMRRPASFKLPPPVGTKCISDEVMRQVWQEEREGR